VIRRHLRHAFRGVARKPAFAVVTVLSLAVGIGGTTAIFNLWNSVLHASLPGVVDPERLVMLTTPSASGMWHGSWTSRIDGPRSWVTFAEFEQLRDNASAFETLMAAQSTWSEWRVRVAGSDEQARGRLVSGSFFQVLGVQPRRGRLFTPADDRQPPAEAVISDAYWARRFGRRPEVIGTTLLVQDTPVVVIGVTPQGFVGESHGQQPDMWLPLGLQPRVTAGTDWLQTR
jgi:hypothetical protein